MRRIGLSIPNFPLVWRLQKGVSGSGAHGDINAHIIDLGRYLVGEFKEVCGLMHTFIKERPLQDQSGKGDGLGAKAGKKMGKVTVDDAAIFIGRFENGALANLEATRFALGRKNHIAIEINGSKGSLYFDFEDMNRLKFFDNTRPARSPGLQRHSGDARRRRASLRRQLVAARAHHRLRTHVRAYHRRFCECRAWMANPVQPTFEDGMSNQRVLEAVEESAKTRQWVKI